MADGPVPVFIVPPPSRKKPWWTGVHGYLRYLYWGLLVLGGLRIISLVVNWLK